MPLQDTQKKHTRGSAQQRNGAVIAILRPQDVVGPHDQSDRYTFWVRRTMQGGVMLAPGDGTDHVQFIDVRDLARFTATVLERNFAGSYNLAGPRFTWAEFMRLLGASNLVWVSSRILSDAGLTFVELPLYRPEFGLCSGLMDMDNEQARQAGLTLTEPQVTLRDVQMWMRGRDFPPSLSPDRERELIDIALGSCRQ